jgi:hypothetical protein
MRIAPPGVSSLLLVDREIDDAVKPFKPLDRLRVPIQTLLRRSVYPYR